MAQLQPGRKVKEEMCMEKEMKETSKLKQNASSTSSDQASSTNGNNVSFKFNAQAPEFVPRSHVTTTTQMPISGYFYPCFHYVGAATGNAGTAAAAASGSDWFFVGDQDPSTAYLVSNNPNLAMPNFSAKSNNNVLTDDLRRKIIKQVEYQFSDMSLLANESMSKYIGKDPEGYVPITFIASTKKMKSLISNNQWLAQALKSSSKLVVSEDGKKIKRKIPFTEKDKEELQSRTVVVENLPDDHSHQNVEKIFNVVGSVKTIRICHPHESNASRSKNDFLVTNRLHALVEFESQEIAEKAVEKLNDERNWRKGLKVRLLLRCSPKSVLKSRKSEFDTIFDEEDHSPVAGSTGDAFQQNNTESVTESNAEDSLGTTKQGWARGRGKGKGRGQSHSGKGPVPSSLKCGSTPQCETSAKQTSKGPRMPDGTKGFTMGRGKPLVTSALSSSGVE